MIGGIFLEIPYGDVYDRRAGYRAHKKAWELFGVKNLFDMKRLDDGILSSLLKIAKDDVSRHASTMKRDYVNRSVDLMRSLCVGIYYNGVLKDMYRFKGGAPGDANGLGVLDNSESMAFVAVKHHDSPEDRASSFLRQFKLITPSVFSVVIAFTMPYAVRLESTNYMYKPYGGYGKRVFIGDVNRIAGKILKARPSSKQGKAQYGYIFERGGMEILKNI